MKCKECKGTGEVFDYDETEDYVTCPDCNGNGQTLNTDNQKDTNEVSKSD